MPGGAPEVLIAAPGAGLGHLVRAATLALTLEEAGLTARIVSHSVYGAGLARLTGLAIDFIPAAGWAAEVGSYAQNLAPGLVVLDSFPWGLRGEWLSQNFNYVFLARRLKVDAYLEAARLSWPGAAPQLGKIILTEPVDDAYLELLTSAGGEIRSLPGRIRFPAENHPVPEPEELTRILENEKVWLVAHSGPDQEVRALAALAEAGIKEEGTGRVTLIRPRPTQGLGRPCFEYFPAARLHGRAHKVVAAAGYNTLAEAALCREKFVIRPMERRYDDQAGRLAGPEAGRGDGARAAAGLIAGWL